MSLICDKIDVFSILQRALRQAYSSVFSHLFKHLYLRIHALTLYHVPDLLDFFPLCGKYHLHVLHDVILHLHPVAHLILQHAQVVLCQGLLRLPDHKFPEAARESRIIRQGGGGGVSGQEGIQVGCQGLVY
jgi:hypothetical protein